MSDHFQDEALANAFPSGARTVSKSSSGARVVALQYGLGRLGLLQDLCDGRFGNNTQRAVITFQEQQGLVADGLAGAMTLKALDQALLNVDSRVPAVMADSPLAYLSDFRGLGLPRLVLDGNAESFQWGDTAIRKAYGTFVGFYWPVMKANKVEGDCKNIALFLMDQFRKQLKEDEGVALPHPMLKQAQERDWIVATRDQTAGLFSHMSELEARNAGSIGRHEYGAVKNVQHLDTKHSMIYGVNVHYPEISANRVAQSVTRLFDWNPAYDNDGDLRHPEVPINRLMAGDMIFIDHTGNGTYDHTVTVIELEHDDSGRVRQLVLSVGSYDDVRDNSAATVVNSFAVLNPYSEEVVVELNTQGHIVHSEVTYTSEPVYLVKPRYSASTTLMEKKRGGKLIVGYWG